MAAPRTTKMSRWLASRNEELERYDEIRECLQDGGMRWDETPLPAALILVSIRLAVRDSGDGEQHPRAE